MNRTLVGVFMLFTMNGVVGSAASPSAAGTAAAAGSGASATGSNAAPAPASDESAMLDAKIVSLQDAKTCVINAKTKSDVAACQKAMRIDSKRKIEVHGY